MAESSGNPEREVKAIRVGILTVSDRCSAGQAEDKSGTNLKQLIEAKNIINGEVCVKDIVPDEVDRIKAVMTDWTDKLKLDLILSTGGTGFTARDVTPEATKSVLDRDAIGFTVAMLAGSLNITPLAMLSRLTCGIRKSTLILNLPGSTKGAEECFRFAAVGVSHAVDQLRGVKGKVKKAHAQLQGEGIHTDQPGQIQNISDESLGSAVEQFEDQGEIPDSVIESTYSSESVSYVPLDSNPLTNSSSDIQENHGNTNFTSLNDHPSKNTTYQGQTVPNMLRQRSSSLDKRDNSNSADFTQLCFPTDQSSSSLPSEPLTIISLVANQNNAAHEAGYDKQDKEISELFQFPNNFSGETNTCRSQESRTLTSSVISSPEFPDYLPLFTPSDQKTNKNQQNICDNVYDFNEEADAKSKPTQKSQRSASSDSKILRAKLHKGADEGEVTLVDVGPEVKTFLRTHPYIRGIYLNKGKRDVKRNLVKLRRETKAVDVGSWHRGSHIHDRNRLDDYFELTETGKERQIKVKNRHARDEYVVNWYMWCPGHGNCRRKCGGYGKCENGCKGKTHKQDRHNCSLLVNMKMFLSDLTKWRIHISGTHVPPEPNILWEPPDLGQQRISEDTRDIIISVATTKRTTSSQIQEVLTKRPITSDIQQVPSKKKICRLVSSMKKRRKQKNYKIRDETSEHSETLSRNEVRDKEVSEERPDEGEHDSEKRVNVSEAKEKEGISKKETSQKALQTLHAVSDSAQLDESNIVPSASVFKILNGAGHVLYFTRRVPHGETISLQTDSAVPHREFVLPPVSVGLTAPGLVYTASCDGMDMASQDQNSSDQLGVMILDSS